jgi:hypothetical protein
MVARPNWFKGLLGLGMGYFGVLFFVYGFLFTFAAGAVWALPNLGGSVQAAFVGVAGVLGMFGLLLGSGLLYFGFRMASEHADVLLKRMVGIGAAVGAVGCLALAIAVGLTGIGLIGSAVLIVGFLVCLLFADYGFDVQFSGKFLRGLPVIGRFASDLAVSSRKAVVGK